MLTLVRLPWLTPYRGPTQILGVDVMLDDALRVWVLEVRSSRWKQGLVGPVRGL